MNYKLQAIWLTYHSSLFTHDCIYAGDRVCDCRVASLLAMTEGGESLSFNQILTTVTATSYFYSCNTYS